VRSNRENLTFAVNVSWLFPDLPFRDRLAAVVAAGFDMVEFGFPSHADLDALAAARIDLGLKIVNFNQDVPVWDRQNRGCLVDPARRGEFFHSLDEAIAIAGRLGAQKIMLPAGVELDGLSHAAQRECILANLRAAAPMAERAGLLLTIEVLNPTDNPGYFLTSSQEALEILQAVDHPHVKFQFDTYHLQMQEGHLPETIRAMAGWIGHFQFADYPGRHEPGTGSIDFEAVLEAMQSIGYEGAIGLEYKPSRPGASSLDWAPRGNE
jgi:hydroxypyruvate isomerase